jgi:hypothetical protein
MKAINLTLAFLGLVTSTIGLAIVIVSVLLNLTETAISISFLTQNLWILSMILIGSTALMYVSSDMLNENLN